MGDQVGVVSIQYTKMLLRHCPEGVVDHQSPANECTMYRRDPPTRFFWRGGSKMSKQEEIHYIRNMERVLGLNREVVRNAVISKPWNERSASRYFLDFGEIPMISAVALSVEDAEAGGRRRRAAKPIQAMAIPAAIQPISP